MKKNKLQLKDTLREEYDFSTMTGVRGKYVEMMKEESNIIMLDDDVFEHFKNEREVNEALRSLIKPGKKHIK